MGKKHRDKRKDDKKVIRLFHYKENEFGERRRIVTKADIRRHLVETINLRLRTFKAIEHELVDIISKKAIEEVHAIEDVRTFEDIYVAVTFLTPTV